MAKQRLSSVWIDNPHTLITSQVGLEGSAHDFDLEATLQFVNQGMVNLFDFSAYVLVAEDGSNVDDERSRVTDEIKAVDSLLTAVEQFHADFTARATEALDFLATIKAPQ